MSEIVTYKNKLDLVADSSVSNEYKWCAADANMVKKAINDLATITETTLSCTVNNISVYSSKLYIDVVRRRCEFFFDTRYEPTFSAGAHYNLFSIPTQYLPKVDFYGWGTGGSACFLQVKVSSIDKAISIWSERAAITVRGGAIWYY